MSQRDTVRANGAELAIRIDGEAGKPWLLVSNSLAADARMWDDQIPFLTLTHRVVRYDTRGHGESSAPPGPYSFDMLVADMVAILDHLRIGSADVLGLSMGGMTALGLGLTHPDRVRSLIVADARADNPAPFVQRWDMLIGIVHEKGMQGIVGGTLERWFTERTRAERPDVIERAREMILKTSPSGYIASARALQQLDYLRHLPKLTVPVLYVVGSEDGGAPKETMQAMAEATPDSRFVVLDGLAHIGNMEDPQAFNRAIEGWLTDAAARAPVTA